MAKVYQRATAGRVEMDHPNHSTSHDPEIKMHNHLLRNKAFKDALFPFTEDFKYRSFNDCQQLRFIVLKMRE
jgi:hypothetical protein